MRNDHEKTALYAKTASAELTPDERFHVWMIAAGMAVFIVLLCCSQVYGLT
jgi:hypothetical protein